MGGVLTMGIKIYVTPEFPRHIIAGAEFLTY
jgi:hypothetical protein